MILSASESINLRLLLKSNLAGLQVYQHGQFFRQFAFDLVVVHLKGVNSQRSPKMVELVPKGSFLTHWTRAYPSRLDGTLWKPPLNRLSLLKLSKDKRSISFQRMAFLKGAGPAGISVSSVSRDSGPGKVPAAVVLTRPSRFLSTTIHIGVPTITGTGSDNGLARYQPSWFCFVQLAPPAS